MEMKIRISTMGRPFIIPSEIKELASQQGKPIVAPLLSAFRQIEASRTCWKGHPDFGPDNENGTEIIAMIRDNMSANFQSYIRDAVPELEFHTLSTLRTFKRALLTAAIRKECG